MSRRNVVVESVRQKRQRMLYNERDDVLLPLEKRFKENRAEYYERVELMHANQRLIDRLQEEAMALAGEIEEAKDYYQRGEMEMLQWPKELNMESTPPKMSRFTSRDLATEWNVDTDPSTPTVSCFVNQHSPGTPPHLITECDVFRKYSPTDRAQLIRRNNRCWGCWLPRRLENGKMHNGDECDYPRHCRRCRSHRHHKALCGAALVMRSTYEKARQAGCLIHQS